MQGIVVAGTRTGVGKTSITLALLKGLTVRGYDVQSFKVGPGFVDTALHERVSGRPCYNLDPFLMGDEGVRRELAKSKASLVVIEGASGMYTGLSSTARVADLLGAPIFLVLDASASSDSVAATALGFAQYAAYTPYTANVAGVIATRVGSETHLNDIRRALTNVGLPLVGAIHKDLWERNRESAILERKAQTNSFLAAICDGLDVAAIASKASAIDLPSSGLPSVRRADVSIGIAYDDAFCFYYRSNLEALEQSAVLEYFSPLTGELPQVDALYVGGGYPEAHLKQLSANASLLDHIRERAADDMPIYAEGGGLAYLSRSITTREGFRRKLVEVLPADVRFANTLQAVGHSEVEVMKDSVIATRGERLRGHTYHHLVAMADSDARFAYRMMRGEGIDGRDGIFEHNSLASCQHVHVYGMRNGVDTFVAKARRYARS